MARIGILGGTFNPIHIGHLRLALETAERLQLERVDLLPCYAPAHKNSAGLLPFDLRVAMLRAAIAGCPKLAVSTLEEELPVPSYTINSLDVWNVRHPDDSGIFILGAEDFDNLETWHLGKELPLRINFIVMARADSGRETFRAVIARLWPQIDIPDDDVVIMPTGTTCRFLVMPSLDISASLIRNMWLHGQDIRYLLPDAALAILQKNATVAADCWSKTA